MASLKGLPPLPKSLSGLISGLGSAQWKEMERIHAMRTMIQQDISRSHQQHHEAGDMSATSADCNWSSPSASSTPQSSPHHGIAVRKSSTLDAQMALLRKEMVGLRQLDMSLLCQLWSLNESLLDYKHQVLLQQQTVDDRSCPVSPTTSTRDNVLAWDNGYSRRDGLGEEVDDSPVMSPNYIVDDDRYGACTPRSMAEETSGGGNVRMRRGGPDRRSLHMLQEFDDDRLSVSSSATTSSKSSLEFGDI